MMRTRRERSRRVERQRGRAPSGAYRVGAAAVLLGAAGLLGGCGAPRGGGAPIEVGGPADGGGTAAVTAGPQRPASAAAGRADAAGEVPAALRDMPAVRAALSDFTASLGAGGGPARVVAVSEVTWPDSALGCPQPGEMYTQALVPGYRVRLAAGDATAEYHTNRGRAGAVIVRRCAADALVPPGADPAVLESVRRDLAGRVPPGDDIALDHTGPSFATALTCPGTPEPTVGAAPGSAVSSLALAVTDVVFRVGADRHLYRVWQDRFVYCGLAPELPPGEGTPTVATE